jgi:protein-tyrosine phosphatase
MTELAPNWISLAGGVNVRDVGGLPTTDGPPIRAGVLIRSANLQYLTPEDVEVLVKQHAVRRIVDLRTDVEVDSEGPGPLHQVPEVLIHHLSLYPNRAVIGGLTVRDDVDTVDTVDSPETPERPETPEAGQDGGVPDPIMPWHGTKDSGRGPLIDTYVRYLENRPDSIVAALRAIAEPDGATVVHCAAGKDRTGVVVALALSLAGVDSETVAAEYAATQSQLGAIIEHLGRSGIYAKETAPEAIPSATAAKMRAVLGAIEKEFGGVQNWLTAHAGQDWTAADTERLRARLRG